MDAERWSEIQAVLADALPLEGEARRAYLDRACGNDRALRARVEALLAADAAADDFLDAPALPREEADTRDANEGRTIGAYVLDRLIGTGGMGSVYLAHRADEQFEQRVAVKMLRRGLDTDVLVRRFRHERQILASLNHPNIARLFDGGSTDDGLPYFVMELVDGQPIDAYADTRRLTIVERLRLCLPIIDAVEHAHTQHVVHRDLKPSNVLVTSAGHAKLLDFGIAKVLDLEGERTSTLTSLTRPMTPDYASPEQVRGEPVTPATDVYAMGLLLYELLAGQRAYRLTSRTPDEVTRLVCNTDPERPSAAVQRDLMVAEKRRESVDVVRRQLANGLDEIVLKALRKDPRYRYPSMRALGEDIRNYLDAKPVTAGRGAWRYRSSRFVTRHRLALTAAALASLTMGATVVLVRGRVSTPPAASATQADQPARPVARRSVAVSAFRSLTAAPSDAWLATALAEMLSTELAGGGQLRIIPGDVVSRAERDRQSGRSADAGGQRTDGEAVAALRTATGADLVAVGTYAIGPSAAGRALRLDVRLVGADSADAAVVAQSGNEADMFALVTQVGQALRQQLGVEASSPAVTSGVRAALPATPEGNRMYAEAVDKLRAMDPGEAQKLFERAAALEPQNALIQSGLASAWTMLGYDGRALDAATRAFDASKALTREDRLTIEGRLYEAQKKWPDAVNVHKTLWGFFSDNAEYGLRLAAAQISGGMAKDALTTIAELRQLPAPQNADPRIDLAEAAASVDLGQLPAQLAAVRRAVAGAARSGMTQLEARARLAEGRALFSQSQYEPALETLSRAHQLFTASADRAGVAATLDAAANAHADLGHTEEAERLYRESLVTAESVGDRRMMALAANNYGVRLKEADRLDEARVMHTRALTIRRELGDRIGEATSLNNLGNVSFYQDRNDDALAQYGRSLEIARELGDVRSVVRVLHNRGLVLRDSGDVRAARAAFEESIPIREEINDRRGGVIARGELGTTLVSVGDLSGAERWLREALTMAREAKFNSGEAQALAAMAELARVRGDIGQARQHYEASLRISEERQDTFKILSTRIDMSSFLIDAGDLTSAEPLARELVPQVQEDPFFKAEVFEILARTRLAAGDVIGARRAMGDARAAAKSTSSSSLRWLLETGDARVELAAGQFAAARRRLEQQLAVLAPTGMVLDTLETRALLAEVLWRAGDPEADRAIDSVAADAAAIGAELIRRNVSALRGQRPTDARARAAS